MENKLQELTQKLYDEGLAKGREQAENMLTEAKSQAEKIISEANYEAERIRKEAERQAEDLHKNTLTELSLAGKQAVAKLKDAITELIIDKSLGNDIKQANLDAQFVREILTTVASNWTSGAADVSLVALLPESEKAKLDQALGKSAKELMDKGLEIKFSDGVESGFKIGPKNGGYYISFTDESYEALLKEYLRPKAKEILFAPEEK
ncbi:MAG: hypothetical protein LUF87_07435 [Alistipes sp.]|nr:hypothetical protein [Alistipes sp.]